MKEPHFSQKVGKCLILAAVFFLCVFCINLPASSISQTVLRVIASDFPPYTIESGYLIKASDSGQCRYDDHVGYGIDIDILTTALTGARVEFSIKYVPYMRLKHELESGVADVATGLLYNTNDAGQPKWNYILYDSGGATIFYKSKDSSVEISSIEDFKGLRVGVVRGDDYGEIFAKAKEKGLIKIEAIDEANYDLQNFRKLMAKRVDVIAINNIVGPFLVKKENLINKIERLQLQFEYGRTPEENGIHIAFTWKVDNSYVDKVAKAISQMQQDGTISCIKSKYSVPLDNSSSQEN